MIEQAEKRFDLKRVEERTEEFWQKNQIYNETKKRMKGRERFYFLDGPPYASGSIHLGTAWNKILKDAFLRSLVMKGFDVKRQPGWDCHGLPIEVMVEKKHGLKSKKGIAEMGVEKFIEECKSWALKHVDLMTEQFKRLGVWMDWDNPYLTLKDEYIEAAWWTIKRAHEKNLLVNDYRVVTWCPRCETALAEAEIEYQDRSDVSIYVKFPVAGREDEYIVIWTTTPWTLIGNLAVMVHPDYEYVRAQTEQGVFILASSLAPILKGQFGLDYEIVETMSGRELEGLRYTNPLAENIAVPEQKNAYQVILADFVTLEEGTGCVHCAPGHGPEDFEAAKPYDIKPLSPVDEGGKFTSEAGKYTGLAAKKDDQIIIDDLESLGALLEAKKISHRYGHCWRCKSSILYRSTKQWFIKITELKEQMLGEIEKPEWVPDWAGSSRFRDWIENTRDWTISRQRYWGIPLPIWICSGCGAREVIGSKKELESRGASVKELHKPFVDDAVLDCSCGGKLERVPDVLDVWFDSGVAAWASLGYPARDDEISWYPADLIAEGHDQTRGWFYSLLGCGLLAYDEIPYKRVLMHGFTLDEKGNKMSKSLGNVVAPSEVVDRYGVDVLRFYVLWTNKPWDDLKFNWREIDIVKRMFNIFWNVYVFSTTYMSIDDFNPASVGNIEPHLKIEDKWLLSRFNTVLTEANDAFDSLHLYRATRALHDFILEDLSRWYVPLTRQRTWIEKDDPAKLAAYHTLWTVLKGLSTVMAPISPHVSEDIYRNLVAPFSGISSVHLESWLLADDDRIDSGLEADMDVVKKFSEAVASAREKTGIKRRWPLQSIIYKPVETGFGNAVEGMLELVLSQANAKELKITDKITGDIESHPDRYARFETELGEILLDTERTDEIIREGYGRELVRRIQQMRKDLDLNVESFISVNIEIDDPDLPRIVTGSLDYIGKETRAEKITLNEAGLKTEKTWEIEGKRFIISIGG